jgi:hypothetical protein
MGTANAHPLTLPLERLTPFFGPWLRSCFVRQNSSLGLEVEMLAFSMACAPQRTRILKFEDRIGPIDSRRTDGVIGAKIEAVLAVSQSEQAR